MYISIDYSVMNCDALHEWSHDADREMLNEGIWIMYCCRILTCEYTQNKICFQMTKSLAKAVGQLCLINCFKKFVKKNWVVVKSTFTIQMKSKDIYWPKVCSLWRWSVISLVLQKVIFHHDSLGAFPRCEMQVHNAWMISTCSYINL